MATRVDSIESAETNHGHPTGWARFPQRLVGALGLDRSIYEEIEEDPSALWQAALVVALAGCARGITATATDGTVGVTASIAIAFIGWGLITTAIWFIGVILDKDTSSLLELLRTIGFSAAPIIVLLFAAIPIFRDPMIVRSVAIASHAAAALALLIATREALDVSTARAAVFCGGILTVFALILVYALNRLMLHLEGIFDLVSSSAMNH